MNLADKIDNNMRLLLTKVSGGAAVIGFLIVVREIGWHDVGGWPAGIALLTMLVGTILVSGLSSITRREGLAEENKSTSKEFSSQSAKDL